MSKWLQGFFLDYQVWATLVSVAAGFAGIMVTLIVQRQHDLSLEDRKEQRARHRLLVALKTEICKVAEYASHATEGLDGKHDFLFPKRAPFPLFEKLSDRIDLLTDDEIEKVTSVYVWLQEIPQRLSVLVEDQSAPVDYIVVPRTRINVIKSLFGNLIEIAKAAEASLDKGILATSEAPP